MTKRTIYDSRIDKRPAYTDKRARKRSAKKLRWEQQQANIRARYGPKGKPAPVTVKTLDGTVIATVSNVRVRNGRWFRPETVDEARERRHVGGRRSDGAVA